MRTALDALPEASFDLLVIGGGIQGAAIAREAALSGVRVLLVERTDFAAGTSSRSSRLVHGGVRYLEHGHFALLREALRERERLLRLCPHLVRPLPMLMPFFRGAGKSAWQLRLGLRVYQWLAGRSTLPGPRHHGPRECARLFPGLREHGLTGGTLFFDAATQDARLTLANLEDAHAAGAVLANHVAVTGARAGGVVLRDELSGREALVRASRIVNATGPHADQLRVALGIDAGALVRTSRGAHLVLAPRAEETALAAFLPDGRICFVIPHAGGTLCGTTEVEERIDAHGGEPTVQEDDVAYLLDALKWLLAVPARRDELRFAYSGWRSLPASRGPAGGLNREAFLVPERCGAGELHTVVGGKLTTHRAFAERVVRALFGKAGSPTRARALPGGDGPRTPLDPLWWRFGSRAPRVRELARGRPELLRPICAHRDLLRVEALHALRELGAVTFTDLMLRRLVHVAGPCLEPECLAQGFALFAEEAPHARAFAIEVEELRSATERMAGHAWPSRSALPSSPTA